MNPITTIQPSQVPPMVSVQTGKQDERNPDSRDFPTEKTVVPVKSKKPEELVMKPTPIPLEEKLEQIISADEVKDLLSLVTRTPMPEKKSGHQIDFKR